MLCKLKVIIVSVSLKLRFGSEHDTRPLKMMSKILETLRNEFSFVFNNYPRMIIIRNPRITFAYSDFKYTYLNIRLSFKNSSLNVKYCVLHNSYMYVCIKLTYIYIRKLLYFAFPSTIHITY